MNKNDITPNLIIQSFPDFIEKIKFLSEAIKSTFFLFRGQEDDFPLSPKIIRKESKFVDVTVLEEQLVDEFKRRSYPYLDYKPATEWDWLALMQHYGLPTRLLDWTENPLAALWFACIKEKSNTEYRVVHYMIVTDEHIALTAGNSAPYKQDDTKIFKPNHITPRITAQAGWFTVHNIYGTPDNYTPFDKTDIYKHNVSKFYLPDELKDDMLLLLDKLGINSSTLFPDLDGLSNYLEWKNYFNK